MPVTSDHLIFTADAAAPSLSPEAARGLERLTVELLAERARIEQCLHAQEPYRALLQLEAREAAGRPLEALRGADMRQHLIAALSHPGDYHALRRLERALKELRGEDRVPVEPKLGELKPAVTPMAPTLLRSEREPKPEVADQGLPAALAAAQAFAGTRRTMQPTQQRRETAAQIAAAEAAVLASVARLRSPDGPAPDVAIPAEPSAGHLDIRSAPLAEARSDQLERIRGIDAVIAAQLRVIGVSRYAQIAQWTAADVAKVRASITLEADPCRQNWIEQAALLAQGRNTRYARRFDAGFDDDATHSPVPPVRRYGDPPFFRVGLLGSLVARTIRAVEAPPRRSAPPEEPLRPAIRIPEEPMVTIAPRQHAVAPPPQPAYRPVPPPAFAATSLPERPVTAQPVTARPAIPQPRSVSPPVARPLPRGVDPTPSTGGDDWAEVTIVPRATPPERSAIERVTIERPVAERVPVDPMQPPVPNLRPSRPAVPLRSDPRSPAPTQTLGEEASVEIRSTGAQGNGHERSSLPSEFGPLQRWLRVFKPGDRD